MPPKDRGKEKGPPNRGGPKKKVVDGQEPKGASELQGAEKLRGGKTPSRLSPTDSRKTEVFQDPQYYEELRDYEDSMEQDLPTSRAESLDKHLAGAVEMITDLRLSQPIGQSDPLEYLLTA